MTRAHTPMGSLSRDVAADLEAIHAALPPELMDAFHGVATFCAIAERVIEKTNPSKVRDAARTVEIKARMDGVPVEARHSA